MNPPARSLLRARNPHGHHRVTFLELFFDLVFVFAITQLSHALIANFSLLGALETLVLLLAVWWSWICTSWVTNWLDPEKLPVRLLLLVLMLVGLLFTSSLPRAYTSRGLVVAGSFFAMEVGRTFFFVCAVRDHPGLRRNFQRMLFWFTLGGAGWLAGAGCDGPTRLAWWAAAIVIAYASASIGFWTPGLGRSTTHDWNVDGGHLAERCGLFIIIALGESILVTGATFSNLDWTPAVVAAFAFSISGSMAMWWLYFATSAGAASERFAASEDPGRLARLAYTYLHLPIVAGIIMSAVADESVLKHPLGRSDARTAITVLGAGAAFLLGNALFKWAVWRRLPASPFCGILVLAGVAPAAGVLPPLALLAIAMLVMAGIAAWEAYAQRYWPESFIGTPHPAVTSGRP